MVFDSERDRIIRTFSAIEREKFLSIGGVLPEHMPEPDEEWYVPDLKERFRQRQLFGATA